MKYIFGPVNSRRLGRSLGIDLFQKKTCNFNCIYCEVGENEIFTSERCDYTPTLEIMEEIDGFILDSDRESSIDVFTVTASGEPTLHAGIGTIIDHLKNISRKPIALLTNGTLFPDETVRHDVRNADIIIPSLDSARPSSFRKINRPLPVFTTEQIVSGLELLRRDFSGQIWLEILFVKGVNDKEEDIIALQKAIRRINPDRIQLNTVARPPLESFARPLSQIELTAIQEALVGPVEIIADFKKIAHSLRSFTLRDISDMLQRRPCTLDEILSDLEIDNHSANQVLEELNNHKHILKTIHNGKEFYQLKQ